MPAGGWPTPTATTTPLLASNASRVHGWPKPKRGEENLSLALTAPIAGSSFSTFIRPGQGATSACLPKHDFLRHVRMRQGRWLNSTHVLSHNLWQRAIDDKLLGYIFARSVGVPTPSVLFCDDRGPMALPEEWPPEWGCCFVIKPLYGFNDFGVMLIENGVDRFTGTPLGGRADVIEHMRATGVPRMHKRTVYIETVVRAERRLFAHNDTPPDYKFFMFGGTVGSVAIITGRKTPKACMAWVDEHFQRVDVHGCTCRSVDQTSPCVYKHCDAGSVVRPTQWATMVQMAKRLGGIVGVHMRIDLFASARGTPTLGEFTPWHSNGKMHCDMRQLDSRHLLPGATRRRHGTTGEQHWVDMCRLGRIWYEKDELEGGVARGSTPAAMRGWPMLMYNEHGKCLAATKLLQPASWSGTGHGADATKLHRDK